MPETPTDAALYDLLCPTLVGTKYLVEALILAREQGRTSLAKEAAALQLIARELGTAADSLYAWWAAK